MLDPGHIVESVTVEEDPHESMPIISVETGDDGTTRRTETKVSFMTTFIPSVSDTLSLDGTGSVTGIPGCNTPMDRVYRPPGGPMDYPTATVPRNYHYGPPGYDDFRSYPSSEAYASLNRGIRMDDRYRSVPVARPQLDPYTAQP
uniref:Uncharacterized protein n=1 Tax=Cyprinus carpio TaxID=7962 RepID=A0A8C2FEX0_CYPCA